MLSFILHISNRNIKWHNDATMNSFYRIKDIILSRFGKVIGYDVQKIDGKKCWSCDGTGTHARYSNRPPYNVYDWDDCYHCAGGWYKLPKWICLLRIKFGSYEFHKPLKRHESINNPFSKEELGWEVTDRPVIKGYIEHQKHMFGEYAIGLLFLVYDWDMFKCFIKSKWTIKTWRFKKWIIPRLQWQTYLIVKPELPIKIKYQYADGFRDDDLPF